ncbi:MAG TPA: N-acetyl-gamma-glutamyl-phosphate reductase [Gammaproteobacteria bacterium]|nr:N-acetyl-gamma-glutamyl-phosphate reductase [Gammaproteobacteria bacterium]
MSARIGIVGGSGYTGIELLRILLAHPAVTVTQVTSRAERGQAVASVYPSLRGHCGLLFVDPADPGLFECDLVFFATPNGTAMRQAPALLDAGVRVVDLAADFRLRDPAEWERWYGEPHACPELLEEAVYGLVETARDAVRGARLVANPGCYPTAVQLGLWPLLASGSVDCEDLIADTKSGVSGAGRHLRTGSLYAEAADSLAAYGVSGHRHWPEIRQGLTRLASGRAVGLTFVPHLTPMIRGIHATLYARPQSGHPAPDWQALFEQHYAGEAFVDVLPQGQYPDTRSVRGANTCRIAVEPAPDGTRVVVMAVIDNLVKGAAGQAVQNMNVMLGLSETAGLDAIAVVP